MSNYACPHCGAPMSYEYCDMCGDYGHDASAWVSSSSSPPSDDLTKVLELLYDLHKDPNRNLKETDRLLKLFQNLTGKDKPKFWV